MLNQERLGRLTLTSYGIVFAYCAYIRCQMSAYMTNGPLVGRVDQPLSFDWVIEIPVALNSISIKLEVPLTATKIGRRWSIVF